MIPVFDGDPLFLKSRIGDNIPFVIYLPPSNEREGIKVRDRDNTVFLKVSVDIEKTPRRLTVSDHPALFTSDGSDLVGHPVLDLWVQILFIKVSVFVV
jgi:hypothetical protein